MRKGHSRAPSLPLSLTPPSSPTFKPTLTSAFNPFYSLSTSTPTTTGLNTPPPSPTRPAFHRLPAHLEEPQPLNAAKLFLQLRRKSSLAKIQAQKEKAARVVEREEAQSGLRVALRKDISSNFELYDSMPGLFGEMLAALEDVRAERARAKDELEAGPMGGAGRRSSSACGSPLFREWSKECAEGDGLVEEEEVEELRI